MPTKDNDVNVSFSTDPDHVIKGLTSDVTTIECIYDLIDNSIDAARNTLLALDPTKDRFGLPTSYDGYSVDVFISNKEVRIHDNCSGIDEQTLSKKTFTIGSKSQHPFGIGHYGVGLNRAIFKLGGKVNLNTDNGNAQFSLEFSELEVRKAIKGTLTIKAKRLLSTKERFNTLRITQIQKEVYSDLGSDIWLKSTTDEIRMRYGIFTRKGLKISINGIPIGSFGPEIRNPKFLEKKKKEVFFEGVNIYMEAGLHQDYRIKKIDKDYDALKSGIVDITKEYGWYIVCNDRIILVADKSKTTGWTTSWHNEYHGFLGWAYYISEDPSRLPWDSKKTGINTNNLAYVASSTLLKELADDYRTSNRKLRKVQAPSSPSTSTNNNNLAKPEPTKTKASGSLSKVNLKSGDKKPTHPENINNTIHTNEMDYLVYEINTISMSPRTTSLLKEAKEISIQEHSYTAIILLRVLFECALREFSIRHKFYNNIKESYFAEQEAVDRTFTKNQKTHYSPNLLTMITWLLKNPEKLPDDHRRAATLSLGKFKKDLPTINGIIHEDGILTSHFEVNQIRNNAYKALQTLLEN
ncbi:ATP-binding protein [Pseudomonas sp. HLT2-19-2]